MSRTRKQDHPATVPLSDLYQPASIAAGNVALLPPEAEQAEYLQRAYGVTAVRDHANRLAVTVADAYSIRDQRMAAEAELTAEWLANQHRAEQVAEWAKARQRYWYENYMFTLRATPIPQGVTNAHEKHLVDARIALSEQILAAEAEAGIPADVQAQLGWPPVSAAYFSPEPSETAANYPYRPPTVEEVAS